MAGGAPARPIAVSGDELHGLEGSLRQALGEAAVRRLLVGAGGGCRIGGGGIRSLRQASNLVAARAGLFLFVLLFLAERLRTERWMPPKFWTSKLVRSPACPVVSYSGY